MSKEKPNEKKREERRKEEGEKKRNYEEQNKRWEEEEERKWKINKEMYRSTYKRVYFEGNNKNRVCNNCFKVCHQRCKVRKNKNCVIYNKANCENCKHCVCNLKYHEIGNYYYSLY